MTHTNDPVAKLLEHDQQREESLRHLGRTHAALTESINTYRDAWKTATGIGWAKHDLLKAGFIDPTKLPRRSNPRRQSDDVEE